MDIAVKLLRGKELEEEKVFVKGIGNFDSYIFVGF